MSKKRIRAAGYPRVSDEGLEESKTLESQEKEIRRHIAKQGYEIKEEHMYPEAMTAYYKSYRERPQFMKLLEACRRKEIDVVVVTEFGRISRQSDELPLLMGLIEDYGVRVESCTEDYEKSAIGIFLFQARAFASAIEVEKIHYRTSRGKMDRLLDGNLGGNGRATYGFTYIDTEDETSARYVINDKVFYVDRFGAEWSESKIVIVIFEKAEEGWSIRKIAIYLTELGIPTKKGNAIWSNKQVHRILTAQCYIGRAIAMRWGRDEKHKVIPRPQEDHIHLPEGLIPPILVTKDGQPNIALFESVQFKLQHNKTESLRSHKHRDQLGLLRAGYCKCGVCDHKMKVRYFDKAYGKAHIPHPPYYYCRVKNGGEGVLNNHSASVTLAILDQAAWEFALPYLKTPSLIRERVEQLREQAEFHSNKDRIEENLKVIKKKISNLVKLARDAEDDDTIGDLQGQLKELERQKRGQEKLLFEEQEEEEVNAKIHGAITEFEEWACKVGPMLSDPNYELSYAEKRSAIMALGIRATVWPVGCEERCKLEIAPPKIMDLMPLIS